jgi:hypothetical protein
MFVFGMAYPDLVVVPGASQLDQGAIGAGPVSGGVHGENRSAHLEGCEGLLATTGLPSGHQIPNLP